VQLVGDNNSIVNNGIFYLRHFAQTTDGGPRDTVRVAVADLGPGAFTNNGTLTLLNVTGATKLDPTGQYLPVANNSLGNPNNSMALSGPLQGQIIGATTFTNSGTIDLHNNPAPGDVLMITGGRGGSTPVSGGGTFVSNGGSLLLDTVLNEGGVASRSDTLVVDGTSVGAGGATRTFIYNAGGAGALTPGDGILVVEVLDQTTRSAAGAFTLANAGGTIDAGPWEYRLFQGGVNGSNPGDWFLRSTFVPPVPEPVPPLPPVPIPPNELPIIGPRLATYGPVDPLARQLGLEILGTLHERIGDTFEPDCVASAVAAELPTKKPADGLPTTKPGPAPVSCPLLSPSAWARFFGGTFNDRYQAFAEPRADGTFWGFEGGVDLLRGSLIAGHYDRAGLFAAYGVSNANVDGLVTNPAATAYVLQRTGSLNLDAWSGGAYWTHVGPSGWYLDAVLQGTNYTGHATTPISSLPTDGWGFLASLEGGYPIPLGVWPRLVLEPQAQIIWQDVSFGHDFDGIDTIGLGSTSGWIGRVGLLAKSTIVTDSGAVWQPYVRGNLWQDWSGNAATTFSPSPIQVPLKQRAAWFEVAAGGTVRVNANWSAFVQAGYDFAIGSSDIRRNGFTGDIGVRYTW
jgi:outer membrane autotransporter protein